MSELNRLHEIIDRLPARQVRALLTLLESTPPVGNDKFARLLDGVPEEEADEETAASILAAEAEEGELIPHDEVKRRLGL